MRIALFILYLLLCIVLIITIALQKPVLQKNSSTAGSIRPVDAFLRKLTIGLSCAVVVINIVALIM